MRSYNKIIIIIVAGVLVAAFFMPWIKVVESINAWDMVFGDIGKFNSTSLRYIAVIIPISSILIIYGAAFNNENYPISKLFLFILPILTLIVVIITTGDKMSGSDLSNLIKIFGIKIFGIGFWLTLIGSIILPFL